LDSCRPDFVEVLAPEHLSVLLTQKSKRTVERKTSEFPSYEVFKIIHSVPGTCPRAAVAYARGVPIVPRGCWTKGKWEPPSQAAPEHDAAQWLDRFRAETLTAAPNTRRLRAEVQQGTLRALAAGKYIDYTGSLVLLPSERMLQATKKRVQHSALHILVSNANKHVFR
jgi:hypothetical protein